MVVTSEAIIASYQVSTKPAQGQTAQRRPESELRRHAQDVRTSFEAKLTAQRRPESELRRHTISPNKPIAAARTLNEGRSLNSGDTPNRNDLGPFRAIASESSGQITASAVELPIGGAVSQEARRFIGPFTRIFASTGCALWNHRRFANSITGPTACPEHESGTGPSVASPLRFPRVNGTRARNPARGR